MPVWLLSLLAEFLPTVIKDGENVFEDLVHGEGGVEKVAKVAGAAATLANHAVAALAGVASAPSETVAQEPAAPTQELAAADPVQALVQAAGNSLHMPG